jgi:hypothetical protein
MRILPILSIAAVAAFAMLHASPAHATGAISCKAGPQTGWKSRGELERKLKAEGWRVRKSKVDGGCYEVYGSTPDGVRVEAYFHPVTLEKLYVSQRGKVLFRKQGY